MYAVIATGGKQYKVARDQVIKIETLDAEIGSPVEFDQVLLLVSSDEHVSIGNPHLKNVKVIGEIIKHGRGEKIDIIKFRRRKHYMRKQGHRQNYTEVKITAFKN